MLDVVGIGNAIVDVISHADDAFLEAHGMVKGSMALIDEAMADVLYKAAGPSVQISGGSAGNTVAGIASLGGKAGYIGKVRDDAIGHVFRHDIVSAGVVYRTPLAVNGPASARCLIFVSSDAQRTMNTYLGACVKLGSDDIDETLIADAKITYLEGYLFDPPHAQEAFRKASVIAHKAGRRVALSLSDLFCVERHREAFLKLVDHHVDLVFANEAEVCALFETTSLHHAVQRLRSSVQMAAVTCGAKGSLVLTPEHVVEIPAAPIQHVVDTTGAGDLYASGFLVGVANDLSPLECGRLGSFAAAEIISHFGGRPETPLREYVANM